MYQAQTKPQSSSADDELVDVLTAISIISMRLARKLTWGSPEPFASDRNSNSTGYDKPKGLYHI